jgi:hypothetical protein
MNVTNFISAIYLTYWSSFSKFFGSLPKSRFFVEMGLTKETKLEILKSYWTCWGSLTAARRFLHKKDKSKLRKLDDRTISLLGKKLETDCSLVKNTSSGRPKLALSADSITRVKRKLQNSPIRSTRTLSREVKLSNTSAWRILRKELKKFEYKSKWSKPKPQKIDNRVLNYMMTLYNVQQSILLQLQYFKSFLIWFGVAYLCELSYLLSHITYVYI